MRKLSFYQSALLISGLVFLFSCEKQEIEKSESIQRNEKGVIIQKEPLWVHNAGNGKLIWAGIIPIKYENQIIIGGNDGEDIDLLLSLDLDSGKENWRWNEFIYDWPSNLQFNQSEQGKNQKDNLALFQGGDDFICLDVSTGKTLWSEKRKGMDNVLGLLVHGDKYYYGYSAFNGELYVPQIIEADIYSTNWKPLLFPQIDSIQNFFDAYGSIGELLIHEENGDQIISFGFSEFYDLYQNQVINYLSSYNLSKQKYIFEKLQLGDISYIHANNRPLLFDDIIVINSGYAFYGIDKNTGVIIWEFDEYIDAQGNGRFIYENHNNELIAVNHIGSLAIIMKVDPKNGKVIWKKVNEGGHADTFQIYNDILYFIDRFKSNLNAYDLNTGIQLWEIPSLDEELLSSFGGFLVIPSSGEEKGRIIVSSFKNTYCFTTER